MIIGDFNINLLDENNINTIRYMTTIRSNGFHVLNKCSHEMVTRNLSNSIIDHVFTDMINYDINLSILPCSLTDHNAMILSWNSCIEEKELVKEKIKLDHQNLILSINNSSLENINSYSDFHNFMKENININRKYIKINKKKLQIRKPYITTEIRNLCNEKEKLYKIINNSVHVSEFQLNRYKILRNMIPNKIRMAKKQYYSDQINSNLDNPKQIWSTINEVIYNKKEHKKKEDISMIKHDNKTVTCSKTIANLFNDYFIGIGSNLIENIKSKNHTISLPTTRILNMNKEPFKIKEVTENSIILLINSLSNNSSSGYDHISTVLLKDAHLKIIPTLTKIINNDLLNGFFPEELKVARVVPVFKNGDKLEINNFRAISVLPNTSKLYERVIYNQLNDYLIESKFYHEKQYGFINKSNTTAACINLVGEIQKSLDLRKITGCLFVDFSKAFDSVDHSKLLEKMFCLNLNENTRKLFKSYLQNRKQYTDVNNSASEMKYINCGVPQGSILGPLFFNIFINDIFNLKLHGKIQLYADDATLFYSTDSYESIINMIKEDIKMLSSYANDNYLTLNLKKTNYLLFNKPENLNIEIKVDNEIIENVKVVKHLGLLLNEKLDWNDHIQHVRKKILPMSGVLRKLSYTLPIYVLKNLYYAFIHSHLSHLNLIWNTTTQANIKELRIIQNKAIKNIYKLPRLTPTIHLYNENILPIDLLIKYNTIIFIQQLKLNKIKNSFILEERNQIHQHFTRTNQDLVIHNMSTNHGRRSIIYQGFNLYNNIPLNIRNELSFTKFKKSVKSNIFNNSIYVNFFNF